MRKVWAVFQREFGAYFCSPIAYVVMAVFLLLSGFFFYIILRGTQEASMRYTFANMGITLLFLCPLLTMRLLAEEIKSGTIEPLMTDPVTDAQVVVGKYLSALAFYMTLLAPTWLYVVILKVIGDPDMGPIISGYCGLVAMGSAFLAVGLLASSLSKNQIVAGVVSFVALLLLWVVGWATEGSTIVLGEAIAYLSFFDHYEPFRKGMIETRSVFYFISVAVLLVMLSVRVLASRKSS